MLTKLSLGLWHPLFPGADEGRTSTALGRLSRLEELDLNWRPMWPEDAERLQPISLHGLAALTRLRAVNEMGWEDSLRLLVGSCPESLRELGLVEQEDREMGFDKPEDQLHDTNWPYLSLCALAPLSGVTSLELESCR